MKNCLVIIILACLLFQPAFAQDQPKRYEPNWQSLDTRPIPAWFNEAKFGIFVVWGPYSVPAWKDKGYSEWYRWNMQQKDSPTQKFHNRVYGEDFEYEQFAELFTAEMWDPDFWADLFAKSGAKYVVTTANYHDGFCLFLRMLYSLGWTRVLLVYVLVLIQINNKLIERSSNLCFNFDLFFQNKLKLNINYW